MRQQFLSRGVVDDTTLTGRDVHTIPVADHHSGNLEERIGLALRDLVRADGIDQKEEDLDAKEIPNCPHIGLCLAHDHLGDVKNDINWRNYVGG